MKAEYLKETGSATALIAQIQTRTQWAWANHDCMLKGIVDAQRAHVDSLPPFSQAFLTCDIRNLRKSFDMSDDKLEEELDAIVRLLGETIKKLGKEKVRLVNMHNCQHD